jgi:hypothetical protein
MSADWFCKIGEKKVGPLNGQQLKTIVAKGQLKPEHFVRRGSEGPWIPAGRIKGLFPEGPAGNAPSPGKRPPQAPARPLPKAAAHPGTPPTAKATSLPTAAEAPLPPAADIPQELLLGGHHKHHVELNVDSLHIETTPIDVSRRRVKSGLQGMKKDERKKLTLILLCLIGGGMTFGLIVILSAIFSGKLSSKTEVAKDPIAAAEVADSGKKPEAAAPDTKPAQEREDWKTASVDAACVGDVVVKVLKPTRGAPPEGAKTDETYVLIVPVTLELNGGKTKSVELTSWTDKNLKKKVSLTDEQDKDKQKVSLKDDQDKHKSYELLEQINSEGKTITEKRIKVQLVFEAPTSKKPKLQLKLPSAAFRAGGPMICYKIHEINQGDAPSAAAKPAEADKTDKSAKPDGGDSEESTSKSDKNK